MVNLLAGGPPSRFVRRGRRFVERDPALPQAEHDGLRPVGNAEFAQDGGDVILDGLGADAERRADFGVGAAGADAAQDLQFAADNGYKPGWFQDSPQKMLAKMDAKEQADSAKAAAMAAAAPAPAPAPAATVARSAGAIFDA